MFRLAWQTIRARKGSFAAAFVALFASTTLVSACGLLMQSGISSGIGPQRLAGADVLVTAGQNLGDDGSSGTGSSELVPLPAKAATDVASVPGVETAVADVPVAVNVAGSAGRLAGITEAGPPMAHGWSSARLGPFRLSEGREPRRPDEVVLDRKLAQHVGTKPGGQVRLATGSTPATYRVVGLVEPPPGVGELRQAALFVTDARVVELSGRPGSITAVGVLAKPGVDPDVLAARIEARVGGSIETHTGAAKGRIEFTDARAATGLLLAISGSFGGIAALTAMFVVASTLGLAVQQRRREFALLRAIAATPRQVRRMIGAEILVVSVAAAIPGAALGLAAVWALRLAFSAIGVLPDDYVLSLGPIPLLIAGALTVVTAWMAGRLSARRVVRIRPVEALGEAAVEQPGLGIVRWLIGLTFLGGGLTMAMLPFWVTGEAAIVLAVLSVLVLVIAMGLLGPPIVKAAIVLLTPLVRAFGVGGYLAAKNTRANSRRLANAVTPLVLAITLLVVQVSVGTAQLTEVERQARDGLVADVVLASDGTGISPSLAEQVEAMPAVATATPVVRGHSVLRYLEAGSPTAQAFATQGVEPNRLTDTMNLDVRSGSTDHLHGQTVALSRTAADTAGVDVGGTVELFLADGTKIKPKVVAIYGRGMGFGDILLPRQLMLDHSQSRLDTLVLVRAKPGADHAALGAALTKLAGNTLGVRSADPDAVVAAERQAVTLNNLVNLILLVGLFGYLAINVVNTLVMTTFDRRRELALLRLVGTTAEQVTTLMRIEAIVVVGIAVVIGTALSLPPLIGVRLGLSEGQIATPVVSLPTYLFAVAGTAVLGLASILLPARSALRGKPIETIGIRE